MALHKELIKFIPNDVINIVQDYSIGFEFENACKAGSLEYIAELFRRKTIKEFYRDTPAITQEMHQNLTNARHLRNCLAHENGIADSNLGFINFNAGDRIVLNPNIVHDYGLKIREYAKVLWENLPVSA